MSDNPKQMWICGYDSGFGTVHPSKSEAERKLARFPDYYKMRIFRIARVPTASEREALAERYKDWVYPSDAIESALDDLFGPAEDAEC